MKKNIKNKKNNLHNNLKFSARAMVVVASCTAMGGATKAMAQNVSSSSSGAVGQTLLSNKIAGKLLLKIDVGYIYNFSGQWDKQGRKTKSESDGSNISVGTGGVGYGASLGYNHLSGWGVSADYLGFDHKWVGAGTGNNAANQYSYDAN